MKLSFSILIILLWCTSSYSQLGLFGEKDTTEIDCSFPSLDFGYHNMGISFGNSSIWTGFRVNFSDCGIKNIKGINITLWAPERNPGSLIKGISIGLAPSADTIYGISFGLAAVVAERELSGINIGGLAVESDGDIWGINVGGLATVASGNLMGINLGGLVVFSEGDIFGINCGSLAIVSEGEVSGFNFGGLAVVAKGEIIGFNSAPIALVSQMGIAGLNIAGCKVETPKINGVNVSLGWTDVYDLNGFSISCYNRIRGTQKGLVIGLLNIAEELNGLQIGLLNIAKNNRGLAKMLPFVNLHF